MTICTPNAPLNTPYTPHIHPIYTLYTLTVAGERDHASVCGDACRNARAGAYAALGVLLLPVFQLPSDADGADDAGQRGRHRRGEKREQ